MSTTEPKSDRMTDVGMGVLLLAACASGWVVSVGHVYPENLFDVELATEMFHLHSEVAGIALAAAAGTAASDLELARPFVKQLWEAPTPTGQWRYYNGMLTMLGLLQASGRFVPCPH